MRKWFIIKFKMISNPESMPGETKTHKTLRRLLSEFGQENKALHARNRELEYALSEMVELRLWSNYTI